MPKIVITDPGEIRKLASDLASVMPEIGKQAKSFKQIADELGSVFSCPAYDTIYGVCDQISVSISAAAQLTETACSQLNRAASAFAAGAGLD